MTLPFPALPVRPNLCTILTGEAKQSYEIIKSTSPISSPSSPTLVAIKVFISPFLKSITLDFYNFYVISYPDVPRNTSDFIVLVY